ncbi:MAG: glucoamylase family protein [Dokdonella sp.]|uniref:glucoamylase family protein n=1 Tax=Dokdonella sp. TaxID=2291710 RepID=UPI003267A87F
MMRNEPISMGHGGGHPATLAGDDAFLRQLQRCAFAYFEKHTNPVNGLVADKNAPDWPASIAATGLALTCYPVAVENGWMSEAAAIDRTLATLRFFRDAPQGTQADATGHRGFYYHFLDMHEGRRAWNCELSSIDTAFLIAGMLATATYFTADTAPQREIRETAQGLYRRVDWQWMCKRGSTLRHGWTPERGFIRHRWQGYDESPMLHALALGSPTHPIAPSTYAAWSSTFEWKRCYDIDYLYSGPLFTHQLSHAWIDFRGVRDAFMRDKDMDYFENSRRATFVQQAYAIDNPHRFRGYGRDAWGITASEGPGPAVRQIDGVRRRFHDYAGRGAPYGIDDGTLAPWAVLASLPFAPEIVLPAIHHFAHTLALHDPQRYGLKSTFNPTFDGVPGSAAGWVSPYHFGLNLGPIVLMIENHLTGMPWSLMRNCDAVAHGLRTGGFAGGWL